MQIKFSKIFLKQLAKSPGFIKSAFEEKLRHFLFNKSDPILNNHKLKGKYQGYRSINITGDWRAIFEECPNGDVLFLLFGTHNQLYKK